MSLLLCEVPWSRVLGFGMWTAWAIVGGAELLQRLIPQRGVELGLTAQERWRAWRDLAGTPLGGLAPLWEMPPWLVGTGAVKEQ